MSLSSRARRRQRASVRMASRSASATPVRSASSGRAVVRSGLPSQPLWLQYQRIGGNLTPAQVSSILYEADQGDIYRLVQLANEARQKDGHLQSCLFTRETALADLPLTVLPYTERGRKNPRRRDAKIAEFVEDALSDASGIDDEVKSLDDAITHLQSGVYHGHAVAQTVWRKRRDGLIVPSGFRLLNQRRFKFRLGDGQLVWEDRWGWGVGGALSGGVDLQEEYPGSFIVHQPRINGDAPAFEGLSRLLVWCALFRTWTLADWLKLAELSWKPWRIGKFGDTAGEEDKDNLWNILEQLTTNGVAVHHKDKVEVEIQQPDGGGRSGRSNHRELCEFMGHEMSKAILGQTLTTEAGDRGARSLGEVHDDVRKDIRNADAKAVAATLRRDLVRWMVRMNFGDVAVPYLAFETDEAIDAELFANMLKTSREAGMRVPEQWAHETIGMPLPEEGERVLGDPVEGEEEPADPQGNGGDSASEDDADGSEPDETDDDSDDAETPDDDETEQGEAKQSPRQRRRFARSVAKSAARQRND